MQLLTWNINGLRSLTQYYPWCEHKNFKTILDALNADIICFQETKITLERLDSSMAIVPGYDTYFSFAKGKASYSGVAIYVKTNSIKPISAEEGISGLLNQSSTISNKSDQSTITSNQSINNNSIMTSNTSNEYHNNYNLTFSTEELLNLDSEGRCIILDFKMFVLFNLYCPHTASQERLFFKIQFYKVLLNRINNLIQAGREIIIMGDMNVTHKEIDHCDPEKFVKEFGLESFGEHPLRKMFDKLVSPNGWNTVINARPANYGTRLDYILVSPGLMKWFKSCNVEQSIMGSDHCPVVAELYDTINEDGHIYTLKEETNANDSNEPPKTPRLCTKYLPKFMGSQKTLKTFFIRSDEKNDAKLILNEQPENNRMENNNIENVELNNQMENEELQTTTSPKSMSSKSTKSNVRKTKKKLELEKNQKSLVSFFKQQIPDKISNNDYSIKEKSVSLEEHNQLNQLNQLNRLEELLSDSSEKSPNEESTQQENIEEIKEIKNNLVENCKEISITDFNNNNSETISQWNALFAPRPIPKCKVHDEPCKEYRVNKPGPNQGRRFYLCSR
ncbi:9969_t:CDS:2 [Diversispora eburnea]|uniref:DNA-(apurinic or apyrimidinic site) endonuclease 2 n=1 Tax=Diversispora eburnea TaxID=1213867 RepID=A0A9N8WLE7_9GLOM|nr:9969_t:CDS:2 [Diversispora eburnea]